MSDVTVLLFLVSAYNDCFGGSVDEYNFVPGLDEVVMVLESIAVYVVEEVFNTEDDEFVLEVVEAVDVVGNAEAAFYVLELASVVEVEGGVVIDVDEFQVTFALEFDVDVW